MRPLISTVLPVFLGFSQHAVYAQTAAKTQTLRFSGYDWTVKSGKVIGPGPNDWNAANVRVDTSGALHLKIAKREGRWSCGEVMMTRSLGFGTYTFEVEGRIDRLDPNVVLGLFNYTTPEVGPDGTNEIDIEISRWGVTKFPNGNYTVWPAKSGVKQTSKTFEFSLPGGGPAVTTQRFTWSRDQILFESLYGRPNDGGRELGRWLFEPTASQDGVPQHPLPVLMNLWLMRGLPPADGREIEIVVRRFTFTPPASS